MTKTLRPQDVYHQPAGIPDHLIIWQDENSGIAALLQAAQDMIEGKTVSFALCSHQPHQDPTINEIVTFAMGTDSPRYCGENKNPNGAGSHALIPSWYDYCNQPAAIVAAMARAFSAHACYFRIK